MDPPYTTKVKGLFAGLLEFAVPGDGIHEVQRRIVEAVRESDGISIPTWRRSWA